jgi:hypothetical protein
MMQVYALPNTLDSTCSRWLLAIKITNKMELFREEVLLELMAPIKIWEIKVQILEVVQTEL